MKKLLFAIFASLAFGISAVAQVVQPSPTPVPTITIAEAKAPAPSKRGPVFRPTKDQIKQVQTMLKAKSAYSGETTGKLDKDTRAGIKSFQKDNGLKETGTLNRATLEKMGVELTDTQKTIPVSGSSFASKDTEAKYSSKTPVTAASMTTSKTSAGGDTADKPKKVIFRATKEQIAEAQKMLKSGGHYSGEESGKLDDPTRDGLRKYQEANGVKVTGTLNQVTLEKMGIALTDKQKAQSGEVNK